MTADHAALIRDLEKEVNRSSWGHLPACHCSIHGWRDLLRRCLALLSQEKTRGCNAHSLIGGGKNAGIDQRQATATQDGDKQGYEGRGSGDVRDVPALRQAEQPKAFTPLSGVGNASRHHDSSVPVLQSRVLEEPTLAPQTETGWQDISTAPKDGTEVLVFGAGWEDLRPIEIAKWPPRGGWCSAWGDELCGVTHWMPLPAPPASSPTPETQTQGNSDSGDEGATPV